ncbi:MAG TPA: 2-oxoglutarate dehydrogenase E1 component [Azospirillaceae bacterium]|nr:2-oxoglutarate dehydrogenase E1 component [Azospirillaceae bacterium]
MAHNSELTTMLSGGNAAFISELFARYVEDPSSVDPSWQGFFAELGEDERTVLAELRGASWAPNGARIIANGHGADAPVQARGKGNGALAEAGAATEDTRRAAYDSIRALMLVRSYRVRGHLQADLDPLGLTPREYHPELDPLSPIYGFTEADLDRPIYIAGVLGLETATLRQIWQKLQETYCGKIGVEFMHMQDPEQKAWIQERIESINNQTDFTREGKRAILERLTAAESFERFLQLKYTGTKRFGLDGGESLIPALEQVMKRGGQLGLKDIVLGMAHRGRLNVLANVMGKPFTAILSEFQGNPSKPDDVQGSGDVKYHLGTSSDRDFDGNIIHLSLTANPSHLEAVNPVVLGKVRAKQVQRSSSPPSDAARQEVLGLLIHGDAAFAGQGIVPETMAMMELRGYRTGGTVHFIINNQIGFTTTPQYARSGPYSSDVAKGFQAPIFHVNGDDPEAVVHAARIAIEFRQKFMRDVVVDLVCYRRHGHNEGDEPGFTQPRMYQVIRNHPTTRTLYAQRLVAQGVVSEAEAEGVVQDFMGQMEKAFEAAKSYKVNKADWLEGKWAGLTTAPEEYQRGDTAVSADALQLVGKAISHVPTEIKVNSKIVRQLQAKQAMIAGKEPVDWATAEALAFGTLLVEGVPVRLSGQDVGRGTFSQRHVTLYDQENETRYQPLQHIKDGQAWFEAHDSLLSEYGVLGFEYGYSLTEPHALVLWEAQFGDFVNGAQIVVDEYVTSGESKWGQKSGVVLLLPHGFEGQGPDHSSGRIERFLETAANNAFTVAQPSTPASYFHLLRRHTLREKHQPMIVFTPKSMLRNKAAISAPEEFTQGTFRSVIGDTQVDVDRVERVLLCSGRITWDLMAERKKREGDEPRTAIVRLEQLYPRPVEELKSELAKYPNLAELRWVQDEPANMGPWPHLALNLTPELDGLPFYRVSRPESTSPAVGQNSTHLEQNKSLMQQAFA